MTIDHSTYLAYGVRVPVNPYATDSGGLFVGEQVDRALSVPTVRDVCPDVGHLSAGAYDQDEFFLVTKSRWVKSGECVRVGYDENGHSIADREPGWDRQLTHCVEIMGWTCFDLDAPGWFVVHDIS